MTSTNQQVLLHSQVNAEKIIYEDFCKTDDNKYAVSKIWYEQNEFTPPRTLYIQSSEMKLYELSKSNDISFIINEFDNTLYEKIDNLSINYIKNNPVINEYNLNEVKFKTIITELNMSQIKILKLRTGGEKDTKFFMGDKTARTFDDVKKYLIKGINVVIIVEIDKLIIDINSNTIITNVILKQVLLKKLKPIAIKLDDYGFIESNNSANTINLATEKIIKKNSETESKQTESDEDLQNSNNTSESDNESIDVTNFVSQIKKK